MRTMNCSGVGRRSSLSPVTVEHPDNAPYPIGFTQHFFAERGDVQVSTKCTFLASHGVQSVVGEAGLEPTTPGLEGRCSIQLSYSPDSDIVSLSVP
jgi:hypothetical protein